MHIYSKYISHNTCINGQYAYVLAMFADKLSYFNGRYFCVIIGDR